MKMFMCKMSVISSDPCIAGLCPLEHSYHDTIIQCSVNPNGLLHISVTKPCSGVSHILLQGSS